MREGSMDPARSVERLRLALKQLSDASAGSQPRTGDAIEVVRTVERAAGITRRVRGDEPEDDSVEPGLLVALAALRERNPVLADALMQAVTSEGRTSLDDLDVAVAQVRAGGKDSIVNANMFAAAHAAGATTAKSVGNFLRKLKK